MMVKLLCLLLVCSLMLVGCGTVDKQNKTPASNIENLSEIDTGVSVEPSKDSTASSVTKEYETLDDEELKDYLEESICNELESKEVVVEDINAVYISQEYIDELLYNSKTNIYFGFTLDEIENIYNGERYVFTLGEDGNTTYSAFEEYESVYEQVLSNVSVGTGVILLSATVEAFVKGEGKKIKTIIAIAAAEAVNIALSSVEISEIIDGIIVGIEAGDMNEALQMISLTASENYKWNAITALSK